MALRSQTARNSVIRCFFQTSVLLSLVLQLLHPKIGYWPGTLTSPILGPFTQFENRVPYDMHDVTAQVRTTGLNAVAVLLGRGWYAQLNEGLDALGYIAPGVRSLRLKLVVEFTDGSTYNFTSGANQGWYSALTHNRYSELIEVNRTHRIKGVQSGPRNL